QGAAWRRPIAVPAVDGLVSGVPELRNIAHRDLAGEGDQSYLQPWALFSERFGDQAGVVGVAQVVGDRGQRGELSFEFALRVCELVFQTAQVVASRVGGITFAGCLEP